MALNRVDLGIQYFPQFAADRAIANAQIYIGQPDLDPSILANQYQAYVMQENGTEVAVSQPIRTGAGGVPTFNGSPVVIKIQENDYSVKVLSSTGSQIYYKPNNQGVVTDSQRLTFIAGVDYTKNISTSLNLTGSPINETSIMPFFEDLYQDSTTWTFVAPTITFDAPISSDRVEILYETSRTFEELDQAVIDAQAAAAAADIDAAAAAASAALAVTSADNAAMSESLASTAATTALAASEASGNTVFYDTYALANAAVGSLPDLQIVEVLQDENYGNARTRYRKEGGVLAFKLVIARPEGYSNGQSSLTAYPRGAVISHVGDSNTQSRPGYRDAYNADWLAKGGIFEAWTSYNQGANGSTAAGWAGNIATGNQAAVPVDLSTTATQVTNPTQWANPWATVNAFPQVIIFSLGTNDFRINAGPAQIAAVTTAFRANIAALVNFFLENTTATIIMRMPQPIAFANPDPNGFTDCVNADDAAARSAAIRTVYLEWLNVSDRVRVVDTHVAIFGLRADSVTGPQDPEGFGTNLYADTLHPTNLGFARIVQCIARTVDPSLPYGVARKTLPESVYENSYFTYTAYALVSGNGFIDIDPRALDLPNFATSDAGYSQILRRRSLSNIPFSENLLYAGAGERFRRFLACNTYKIYSHKTGATFSVNGFPNASDNTSFWRVLTSGVDLTGISGDYVTFFVDTREGSPHLLERLTGLTINLNGPQPLTAGASGATPNQFLAGSATITRVRGVRQSNSGSAVVSLYVSNQTDGSYNVGTPFPYPGMKLGVLTFTAGARNSGGSAFVWDAVNVPSGSFLYNHNNANLSFNAEVDSGTIGEHGALFLQMF